MNTTLDKPHQRLVELSQMHGVTITLVGSGSNNDGPQFSAWATINILNIGKFSGNGKSFGPDEAKVIAIENAIAKCGQLNPH
ncbi:MAG: hypothetical protein V4469_05285 [Patescibacteria group bacterium]